GQPARSSPTRKRGSPSRWRRRSTESPESGVRPPDITRDATHPRQERRELLAALVGRGPDPPPVCREPTPSGPGRENGSWSPSSTAASIMDGDVSFWLRGPRRGARDR